MSLATITAGIFAHNPPTGVPSQFMTNWNIPNGQTIGVSPNTGLLDFYGHNIVVDNANPAPGPFSDSSIQFYGLNSMNCNSANPYNQSLAAGTVANTLPNFDMLNTDFTIECQIYPFNITAYYSTILGCFDGVSQGWVLMQYNSGLVFSFGASYYQTASGLLTANTWNQIAVVGTYVGPSTTVNVFVNTVSCPPSGGGSATMTSTQPASHGDPLSFGSAAQIPGFTTFFRGAYGPVRVSKVNRYPVSNPAQTSGFTY